MTQRETRPKQHLCAVIVGQMAAGKSLIAARLLHPLLVNNTELKEPFAVSIWLDETRTEQCEQIIIKQFYTQNCDYTIIDIPSHKAFIKYIISGVNVPDLGIFIVPANKGAFETSIAKSDYKNKQIEGKTRQHATILKLLGIEQLIVCINKMDHKSVNYKQNRFVAIKEEVTKMLNEIGYKTDKIPFIPISGLNDDNLMNKSNNMKWFNGYKIKNKIGFTLLDALDQVVKPSKRLGNLPLRMCVSGVLKINGIGDVITGRIEQGKLKSGSNVVFYPSNAKGKVLSIEMHHKIVDIAYEGDNIAINIRGLNKNNMVKVDIMCLDNKEKDINPPKQVKQFTSLVFVQDYPGKLKASTQQSNKNGVIEYKGGFTPNVHVRTAKSLCQMIKILWKQNNFTGKIMNPSYIECGDSAQVIFKPKLPIVVTKFKECKPLGRIACMDSNSLVMLGKVIDVTTKD